MYFKMDEEIEIEKLNKLCYNVLDSLLMFQKGEGRRDQI